MPAVLSLSSDRAPSAAFDPATRPSARTGPGECDGRIPDRTLPRKTIDLRFAEDAGNFA